MLRLGLGGVATSGLNVRIWRGPDGRYAHHLLDPSTGEPAWTGLVGATALADTAVEAETLSKAALLSGPDGGRELLGRAAGCSSTTTAGSSSSAGSRPLPGSGFPRSPDAGDAA